MPRTYFFELDRAGEIITVEYSFSAGSPTTYSPATGAHGGDAPEVGFVSVSNAKGEPVELTANECEAVEEAICNDPPEDRDDYDDWD